MKKVLTLLLALMLCLSLVSCAKTPTAAEVLTLYEEIELTSDNVMDYFELAETEDIDAFGDSTGETAYLLQIKDGYIFKPDEVTVLRVHYPHVTIQYPEGSEAPAFPTDNFEGNELVVSYCNDELDCHFDNYDRDMELLVTDHAYYIERGDVAEGNICATQILDWEITKVSGSIVSYNLPELEKLFPVDKEGYRNVAIEIAKKNTYTEEFDSASEDWEHAYWYEIIYNALDALME